MDYRDLFEEIFIGKKFQEKIPCVVKWFNDSKGFGFAHPMAGEFKDKDCFVHYSAIEGGGFQTLVDGQIVHAVIVEGPKGPQLSNVEKTNKYIERAET